MFGKKQHSSKISLWIDIHPLGNKVQLALTLFKCSTHFPPVPKKLFHEKNFDEIQQCCYWNIQILQSSNSIKKKPTKNNNKKITLTWGFFGENT